MVFAHFWLKETLSRRDLTGTVLIIAGSVLTVSFGDHSDPVYNLDDFKRFFGLHSSIAYTFVIAAVSAVMYGVILYLRPIKQQMVVLTKSYAHLADEVREERMAADTALTSLQARYRPWEKVHPFCYCALSGLLGAQSVLFGKMVSELISTTFQGDNQLLSVFPYIFLVCMLAFVFSQLHFLALALTHFDALYCVPIFQCFFILTSTIGGAAFFEEFASFTTLQAIMFPIGIATTLSGVFLLAQRDSSSVSDSGEGPGHHVIPASLATFFVDMEREKAGVTQVTRSLSHNWQHGGAMSKVQQDKAEMEQMANAAALSAQKGELKLSAEVEASVAREMAPGAPTTMRHQRNSSRAMSSVRTQMRPDGGGAMSPPPLRDGVLRSFDEGVASPSSAMVAEKSRRKLKSRSHPTHFVTPSCLLPKSAVDSLEAEALAARSPSPTAAAENPLSPSAMLASPLSRQAPNRRTGPSSRQQRMTAGDGLAILPMARESSLPVPKHLGSSEEEDEEDRELSPLDRAVWTGTGAGEQAGVREERKESTEGAETTAAAQLLPGQMESSEAVPVGQ